MFAPLNNVKLFLKSFLSLPCLPPCFSWKHFSILILYKIPRHSYIKPDLFIYMLHITGKHSAAAAAKSLQSCPTLCDPTDGSSSGSPIPGILQARTLEWVAISFSNVWKWKVKVKSLVVSDPRQPHGLQPTRLLHPWDFPGKSTGVGCHCLLQVNTLTIYKLGI